MGQLRDTSGHSTFSAAAAAVLMNYFGTDRVRFMATSEGTPGVTRSYASFSAAAAEAGRSRIYGGIHWEFDNAAGLASGHEVGSYVSQHFLLPRTPRSRAGDEMSSIPEAAAPVIVSHE
jgi:hypothetical protein